MSLAFVVAVFANFYPPVAHAGKEDKGTILMLVADHAFVDEEVQIEARVLDKDGGAMSNVVVHFSPGGDATTDAEVWVRVLQVWATAGEKTISATAGSDYEDAQSKILINSLIVGTVEIKYATSNVGQWKEPRLFRSSEIPVPFIATFQPTGIEATSYKWDQFGDSLPGSTTDSQVNLHLDEASPGTYAISARVEVAYTDEDGHPASGVASASLEVVITNDIIIFIDGPTDPATGTSVNFCWRGEGADASFNATRWRRNEVSLPFPFYEHICHEITSPDEPGQMRVDVRVVGGGQTFDRAVQVKVHKPIEVEELGYGPAYGPWVRDAEFGMLQGTGIPLTWSLSKTVNGESYFGSVTVPIKELLEIELGFQSGSTSQTTQVTVQEPASDPAKTYGVYAANVYRRHHGVTREFGKLGLVDSGTWAYHKWLGKKYDAREFLGY